MIEARITHAILNKVFLSGNELDNSVPSKGLIECFVVIPGDNAPSWIVPRSSQFWGDVLTQWRRG